jgi:hypothetical protein
VTTNEFDGELTGSLIQAGVINAESIAFGAAAVRPGLGSAEVPWGRLGDRIRGRDSSVANLVAAARGGAGVVVLHGGGGTGKTTLALTTASAVRDEIPVWWVDATTKAGLEGDLREVAVLAGADPREVGEAWSDHGSAPDLLWRTLDARPEPWLLIVDNADDLRVIAGPAGVVDGRGWLRTPRGGTVLVTSRSSAWPAGVTRHSVGELSDDDGATVLLDLVPSAGNRAAAQMLAHRLGGLALALRLAGMYLARVVAAPALPGLDLSRTFADYVVALDERFVQVTRPAEVVVPDDRGRLDRTWELSLDLLAARGFPLARRLLRLVAVFAAAPIPFVLLNAEALAESEMFPGVTAMELSATLDGLAGLGLAELAAEGLVLHPVVRDSCRWQADAIADAVDYRVLAMNLLFRASGELEWPEFDTWPAWRPVWPHLAHLLDDPQLVDGADDDQDWIVAAVAAMAAGLAHEVAGGPEAERWYRRAVAIRLRLHGPDWVDTVLARQGLAMVLMDVKDHAGAESELREVAATIARSVGADHLNAVGARHDHAMALLRLGDLAGAEAGFRFVLTVYLRVLGGEAQPTLTTRHNLARVLQDQGKVVEAEHELRAVLSVLTRVEGPEHRGTLATRYSLAHIAAHQGDLDGAAAEFDSITAAMTRVLGPAHPDTLLARLALAVVRREQGDTETATAEFRDILAVAEANLSPGHWIIANVRSQLS